jgi:chromosome segregation ATPase
MLATLLKILPVLWPFFKEMVLGGKPGPEADNPSRLKVLFYAIAFLLALLGYGSYHFWSILTQLHSAETQVSVLKEQVSSHDRNTQDLRDDRDRLRADNDKYYGRVRELRDEKETITSQLAATKATLTSVQDENRELLTENRNLMKKLGSAETAADNLSTFKTQGKQTPRALVKHNEAVDVLKKLREDTLNEGRR